MKQAKKRKKITQNIVGLIYEVIPSKKKHVTTE